MKKVDITYAHTAAIIAGGWYIFCWAFYLISPEITQQIFGSWFHAFNIRPLWTNTFQGNFFTGLLTLMASAWITVFLFLAIHKLLQKVK